MSSYDYKIFIASCFPKGPIEGADGLDFNAWYRLSDSEKRKATKVLMDSLFGFLKGEQIQGRVIAALGILQIINALPILKKLVNSDLTKADPLLRAEIGLAIHRISGYPEGIDLAVIALEKPYGASTWWYYLGTSYLSVFAQEYKRAVRYLLEYMNSDDHNLSRASTNRLRELFKDYPEILNNLEVVQESLVLQNEYNSVYILRRRNAIADSTMKIEKEINIGTRWK